MSARLPFKIHLPFGFAIRVVLTTDKGMLDVMDEDDKSELADGLWDVDNRTIYVRRNLPFKRKVEVLGHELDHAINDWRHWARDRFS
jgi:Zn-dependent peptidase ImmA (M78 family)